MFVRSHPKDDDFAEFEDDEEFETEVFDSDDGDGEHVLSKHTLHCTKICDPICESHPLFFIRFLSVSRLLEHVVRDMT